MVSVFGVCVVIFVLLFSYHLTLALYPSSANQQQTIDFVQGKTAQLELNYTSMELSHLDDVRKVMSVFDAVFYGSLLLMLAGTIYGYKRKLLPKMLFYGGISIVSVMGLILLFALFSFNSSFTFFHKLFFPQGNWQFPMDSLLIQTFPGEFFVSISAVIFILAILIGIIFIVIGKSSQRWFQKE